MVTPFSHRLVKGCQLVGEFLPRILDQLDKKKNLIAIRLSRNLGHQVALTAGLSAVNGTVAFVIDADLQDPPELLGEMLRAMEEMKRTWSTAKEESRGGGMVQEEVREHVLSNVEEGH